MMTGGQSRRLHGVDLEPVGRALDLALLTRIDQATSSTSGLSKWTLTLRS